MKHVAERIFFLLLAAVFISGPAGGQSVTEEWLKSEYTILLAGYISWPDEEDIDTFNIGVLASQPVYTQMSLKSQVENLKGKPQDCTPEQIRECHGNSAGHPCQSE